MLNGGRENTKPGIHVKAIALIDSMGDLQYFWNWWKLIVNFWSRAVSIIFQICEPEVETNTLNTSMKTKLATLTAAVENWQPNCPDVDAGLWF